MGFLSGRPRSGFDPGSEPGADVLDLRKTEPEHFYTSGLDIIPVRTPLSDIADPARFRLVSVLVRPYQQEQDRRYQGSRTVPQLRLVYQLTVGEEPVAVEQLFIHVNIDLIDRYATQPERLAAHRAVLGQLAPTTNEPHERRAAAAALRRLANADAAVISQISFSSAVTGIWVFGALSSAYSHDETLQPMRIVREGIDVGYYSSAYDTVLFREALAASRDPERRAALEKHLDDLTPRFYRDPRRSDPSAIRFDRMTCAQCHQMAARDGVHVALNDHLDRRIESTARISEFVYRELDRQLRVGGTFWQKQ
jgi:hypothetical protein